MTTGATKSNSPPAEGGYTKNVGKVSKHCASSTREQQLEKAFRETQRLKKRGYIPKVKSRERIHAARQQKTPETQNTLREASNPSSPRLGRLKATKEESTETLQGLLSSCLASKTLNLFFFAVHDHFVFIGCGIRHT
jgi:hypothetical protein